MVSVLLAIHDKLRRIIPSSDRLIGSGAMKFRAVITAILVGVFWLMSQVISSPAYALTEVKLTDVSYTTCPEELVDGNVTAGGASREAKCYMITGTAVNTSGRPVLNADVFGRIYDASGNPVMQNRTRVGSIDEVPPGESSFELRITVAANQAEPLQLEQFKASGFTGRVRR
ncbi:MAG: FxLYD domain-containing protein [Elainellaceae cyanobacterium]